MTVIAIDGPSGSGKSTAARLIAERLELPYLDTGAMYRSVALVALRREIDLNDAKTLAKIAVETKIQLLDDRDDEGKIRAQVLVNGVDATLDIRTPEISQAASAIAVHHAVRERLVRRQQNWVKERGGAVVEGRDIGSVVFPHATLKVFLTAGEHERMHRRRSDSHAPEFAELSAQEAVAEMAQRDRRDSTRHASPLVVPEDAFVVDTTGMKIDDVVDVILLEVRERLASAPAVPPDGDL